MLIGYILGVLSHIGVKWSGYISAHKDNHWRTYWNLYTPLVIKGTIFDVIILAIWKIGLLGHILRTIGISMPEGYVPPEGVDIWMGIALGYAADSIGKTFMAALERFYGKTLTTLGGKVR